MIGAARALLLRDLRLLWRRRGDALQPALFALLVVVLFALAFGGGREALAPVAAPALWVAVLLAGLLSLDTLFRGDAEDGSLEQWLLAPVSLAWLVGVRTFMHWATTALPLLVATPFLAELLHLPDGQLAVLLPVIRYSVVWWNSLHQGQTIRIFGESSIDPSMSAPLWIVVLATKFWFAGSLLVRARADNLRREVGKDWVRRLATGAQTEAPR